MLLHVIEIGPLYSNNIKNIYNKLKFDINIDMIYKDNIKMTISSPVINKYEKG
jgi:hypothetical protein